MKMYLSTFREQTGKISVVESFARKNTPKTSKIELTNSFAYRSLISGYIMMQAYRRGHENDNSNNHALPQNTLKILTHADRMINSSKQQVLLLRR